MEIISLITGFIIGLIICWLVLKILGFKNIGKLQKDIDNLSAENKIKIEKINFLTNEIISFKNELEIKNNSIISLNKELSSKTADYKNLYEKLQEQKEEINKLNERFAIEFKNLANEIFEEKTKRFTEQSKENITGILKPLQEKIKDFEKKVEEAYDKEAQQRFSLKEEVKRLAELNQQISKEASNLTKALKGESKTQGNWGEIILESILEKSGLVKDREYFVQASFTSDDGKRLQPDVIVKYPGDRNIIIDSKVSLTAYEKYTATDDEKEKENYLKEHIISVKNHINELNNKNYQDIYQLNSIDFVMMFLPVEPAYLTAIQNDTELWNFAYEKRVLLISPTNLIAALKMIVSMWRQEYQNKYAQEIAQRSGDLYDKFVSLYEDLVDVGTKLNATQKSYEKSMNKLHDGKGNLISRIENIKKLGAKTKKSLPENIIEDIADDNNSDD